MQLSTPTPSTSGRFPEKLLSQWLDSLPSGGIDAYQAAAELYRQEPLTWLLGSEYLPQQVFTQDEHDESIPAKPFPTNKPYILEMVDYWLTYKMILWPKSRQMLATWLFCSLYLHDTMFKSAVGGRRLNFIQTKKEEDSDALLLRCYFIYENQDPWLRAMFPAEYSYCHLRFYKPGDVERKLPVGELWAIPQGGDVLRQRTASGLFIDEAAFQPELAASVRAAQPILKGGGRIDLVSSAEPGYFEELCEGKAK